MKKESNSVSNAISDAASKFRRCPARKRSLLICHKYFYGNVNANTCSASRTH